MKTIKIGNKEIGIGKPVFFIADIASNHDGDLERAKMLIKLAKEAGADAAKFQNFKASKIVSDQGFKSMGSQASHQASWKKTVYEIYDDCSIPLNWTKELKEECEKNDIIYLSSPYDNESIEFLNEFIPAYKIGSGEITYLDSIENMSKKQKPIFMATGASDIGEVRAAVETVLNSNQNLILMQCNTNYTLDQNNFNHINLNVLKTYKSMYPNVLLGLSDHTPGHATVLGAVTLGAVAIEKHFTDDNSRDGPDHKFALNPEAWKEMIDRTRELERALGTGEKKVEKNEKETIILQRRCLRATRDIKAGEELTEESIEPLRPCPIDSIPPYEKNSILGKKVTKNIPKGEHFTKWNIE